MQSQVSVLLHPSGRGLLCPHIPRVPSHGQLSRTFNCVFSHFTFLKASPTTFPLPSIPATFLWPPPSHYEPASLQAPYTTSCTNLPETSSFPRHPCCRAS